jgi:hypothetical protein
MKKLWTILKIGAFVVLGLLALGLLGAGYWTWRSSSGVEGRLTALRDAGEPTCIGDLARPLISQENNAATYLFQADAEIIALTKELADVFGRLSEQDDNDPRSTADDKAIRAALEAHSGLFPLLEKAAACPDFQSNVNYSAGTDAFIKSMMAEIQRWRAPLQLLSEQARLQVADGKRDEALHTVVVMLRLARHFKREPALLAHQVGSACTAMAVIAGNRVLRSGPVSAKARTELEEELALADSPAAYIHTLKSERAFIIEAYGDNPAFSWLNRPVFDNDHCHQLDLLDKYITLATRTYAKSSPELKQFQTSANYPLANQVGSSLAAVHAASIRQRARLRCLRVLNAIQQAPDMAGEAAPKIDKLGLPADAIIDPCDGAQLRLRKAGADWIIYSVGINLIDDNGDLKDNKDIGIGPVPR